VRQLGGEGEKEAATRHGVRHGAESLGDGAIFCFAAVSSAPATPAVLLPALFSIHRSCSSGRWRRHCSGGQRSQELPETGAVHSRHVPTATCMVRVSSAGCGGGRSGRVVRTGAWVSTVGRRRRLIDHSDRRCQSGRVPVFERPRAVA
jgi:hypothetical protein